MLPSFAAAMFRPLVTLAAVLSLAACVADQPVAPQRASAPRPGAASAATVDGAHDGDPHFFFLPPLVPGSPSSAGAFDATRTPTAARSPAPRAARLARFAGAQVQVNATAGFYQATWKTQGAGLDPAVMYRIQVRAPSPYGPRMLGYADVVVLANGSQVQTVDRTQYAAALTQGAVQIRFRIETGAGPNASPDGRRIAFTSSRDGSFGVCSMNLDGSDVAELSRTPRVPGAGPGRDRAADERDTLRLDGVLMRRRPEAVRAVVLRPRETAGTFARATSLPAPPHDPPCQSPRAIRRICSRAAPGDQRRRLRPLDTGGRYAHPGPDGSHRRSRSFGAGGPFGMVEANIALVADNEETDALLAPDGLSQFDLRISYQRSLPSHSLRWSNQSANSCANYGRVYWHLRSNVDKAALLNVKVASLPRTGCVVSVQKRGSRSTRRI